jgi:hypothetical protein
MQEAQEIKLEGGKPVTVSGLTYQVQGIRRSPAGERIVRFTVAPANQQAQEIELEGVKPVTVNGLTYQLKGIRQGPASEQIVRFTVTPEVAAV